MEKLLYTVCCSVCGDYMQQGDLRRVPFCSKECKEYWLLEEEDKVRYEG